MTIKITGEDEVTRKPLLSLGIGEPTQSEEFVGAQAARLHLSLGDSSPGVSTLSSALSSGNSEEYRRLLADRDQVRKTESQNDVLKSILQSDRSQITPEIVSIVQGLTQIQMEDPDLGSIIEKKYAEVYTNTAAAALENDILEESAAADPEKTHQLLDRTEGLAFRQNYAAKKLDEAQQAVANQSWAGTGWNFLENIVAGQYQQYDQVDDGFFVTSLLPGANKEEQYAYIWGLEDPKEFTETLDKVVEDLKSRNPYSLQQWLTGLFSYGSSDATLDTAFAAVDLAGLVPVGKLATALKGVVRGATKNPTRLQHIAADLGQNDVAAVGQVVEDLKEGTILTQNIRDIKKLSDTIPSYSDPLKLLVGTQNVPQASYLRFKEALFARRDLITKFLLEPNLIDRLQPEELLQYKDILLREYVRDNPSIQKNVIDVEIADQGDLGNIYQAKVLLGKRDGTLFESEKQAEVYFKRFIGGTNDYRVVQKGQGFQIEILKTVDETRIANDIRLGTSQRTPESLANTFGGLARSPDYLLSEQNIAQRSVAVTSAEFLKDVFQEIAAPFQRLPSKELSELQDLMVDNRQAIKYYDNYGQFEDAFFSRFKKNPTEGQADTYFAYVQINDLDMMVRDLDVYKQKARLGLERITIKDVDQEIVFDGKVVDNLPHGSQNPFRVSIIGDDGKVSKSIYSKHFTDKDKLLVDTLRGQGYKIIQVADQALEMTGDFVGFVLAKEFKRDRVGLGNFERKAGGHRVHLYPFYLKQGRFSGRSGENLYKGDLTLFNFRTSKEAEESLGILEEFRKKFNANDPGAMKYLRDTLPGVDMKAMAAMIKEGRIDLKIPFVVTKRGTRTLDTGAYSSLQNLVDLSKNEHNLSNQVRGRYLGERSESDLATIRSEEGTVFQVEDAPYLSPLETLRMSSANMLSVRVMDDYTVSTRQNFLREFGDILEGTKEEQMSSGIDILVNPKFKPGVDKARQAFATNVSRAYNQFMNTPSVFDMKLESAKEKILASVMPKFGPRGQRWVEKRMLNKTTDPGVFLRSVAFDFKLGLYNIKQFFVQANSMVNITAIAGVNGMKGGVMYPLIRTALLTNSKDNLARIGKIAENIGMMPAKDFEESLNLLKKSGWNNIGGDVAFLDDIASPEIRKGAFRQGVGSVLQWGRTPFQEGERMVRLAAWQAAYLERKSLKKGAALSKQDETAILLRAKNLTGNMTRESNAAWQKGYPAVITQFFGYQARIAEQFIGKKLTGAEKLRLFTAYSAVYGTPVAMGAVAGVIPVRDIIRDQLYSNGVNPDDTALEPFIDGFASSMIEYITGADLNIAGRYGPGGLPTLYDMIRGDKSTADLLLGASGGIAVTTFTDSIPMLRGMYSEWMDYEGGMYNLTKEDFFQPIRNVSFADDMFKLWEVYNVGVWASKNGNNLTEMSIPEAYMAVITGLQPGRLEDSFSQMRGTKMIKDYKLAVQKEVIQEYRRAMNYEPGPDREIMIRRIKARMTAAGFTLREMNTAWRYAFDKEMMTDSVFENYQKAIGE